MSGFAITVGRGRRHPAGELVELEPVAPSDSLAIAISRISGHEAWWSGSAYDDDYRKGDHWRAASAIGIDVDHVAAHRDGVAVPWPEMRSMWRMLGTSPGTWAHMTPRGARIIAMLDRAITDAAEYTACAEALCEHVELWLETHALAPQYSVDRRASCDRARFYFAPRSTVESQKRSAVVHRGAGGVIAVDTLVADAYDANERAAIVHENRDDHEHVSAPPSTPVPKRDNTMSDARRGAYVGAAIDREARVVEGSERGTRNRELHRAACALHALAHGEELESMRDAIDDALSDAAVRAGLSRAEATRTVRSARSWVDRTDTRREVPVQERVISMNTNPARTNGAMPTAKATVSRRLSDVTSRPIQWLWRGRVPLGKLTVLDGDPGLGKSLLTLDLAARVSRGTAMPDEVRGDLAAPAGVVLIGAEDDAEDTIRPRLDAAGADPTRILTLEGVRDSTGAFRLPTLADIDEIESAIGEVSARLVVIDPVMAFLGKADSHRDQDVRAVLAPLAQLAAKTGVAIVIVRHLNKNTAGAALYRGGGSIGIVGAARAGLIVGRDPDDPTGARRILAMSKSNLAKLASALAYTVEPVQLDGVDVPRVTWHGATSHIADDLLASEEERGALADAKTFVREILADGPLAAGHVQFKAKNAGISPATLRRARKALGVKAFKVGKPGGSQRWDLELSEGAHSE